MKKGAEPISRNVLLLAVAALATVATVRVASAHALDIAYLRIESPATPSAPATIELDIDIGAAALLAGIAPEALNTQMLAGLKGTIAYEVYANEPPTSSGPCELGAPRAELVPPSIHLTATLVCPPGPRTWRFPVVNSELLPKTFQLLVKDVASDQLTVVDRGSPVVQFPEPTPGVVATPGNAARGGTNAKASPPVKPTSSISPKTLVGGALALVVILVSLGYLVTRRKTA